MNKQKSCIYNKHFTLINKCKLYKSFYILIVLPSFWRRDKKELHVTFMEGDLIS